jgi:autotransporter strand-loop-strand O-heptosyltransferase
VDAQVTEPAASSAAEPPPPAASPAPAPAASASGSSGKPAFPPPAPAPTREGPKGIRYDFNLGARVVVPEGAWRVQLRDLDSGNILFDTQCSGSFINSAKRFFVRFRIEVWEAGESVFRHDYSADKQEVLIQFPVGTLGDPMGWLPYAVKFQDKHNCKLTCAMSEALIPLFRDSYPHITFITTDEVKPELYYATYSIGLFFDDADHIWQPTDFRHVGLHRTAGYILGVDPQEIAPRISIPDPSRPIAEPYVVIATQASTQCKYWNNPSGWREIVKFIEDAGYRVVCIDKLPVNGFGIVWNHIPHGVRDETGDRPLTERARWLRHAEFFVGLSSGLSWLAWAVGTPTVLISGFTHPTNEFATPYRVFNYHACNSCWNDVRHRFDHHDYLWCPRHANTPRQFECTRLITAEHVKDTIRRIPGFGEANADRSGAR